jgi:cytoskeletal protein RodZ
VRRGVGIAAAWIAATAISIAIAAAAVGSVRSQVTDAPTALGSPEVVALASAAPPEVEPGPPSSGEPGAQSPATTTAGAPPSPATTTTAPVAAATGATNAEAETSTTRAPSASPTTQTSVSPASTQAKTYDTDGGWIRIVIDGELVSFATAQPKTGWSVDVENEGPEEVKIHFERNDDSDEIEFSAKVEDGEVRVHISHGDEDR